MRNTPQPPQDLADQVALVTGANTGIGRVTALELARRGASVFLATRSRDNTQPVLDEIQHLTGRPCARWLPLNLADLASVRACARAFTDTGQALHLLVNNAGVAGVRGLTEDGFEAAFGINHMGHFVLTHLLQAPLQAAGQARVVSVASRAHRWAPPWQWETLRQPTRSWTGAREYATSKLANVLFNTELARRWAGSGVASYAVHPGVVYTDLWRHVPAALHPLLKLRGMLTPEQGAQTTLHCATQAPHSETGQYYAHAQALTPSRQAQDPALAAELWRYSEAYL